MTLLWILLGIAVIIGVARYNESDSLFWKLFICFLGGFIAGHITLSILNNDENRSKDELVQVNPTQGLQMPSHTVCMLYALAEESSAASVDESQNLVGQGNLPVTSVSLISSEVSVGARDQPPDAAFYDTS